MLSSQTKDEVTDAAVIKLRAALGGTLSVEGVLAASEQTIADAICKVGFWPKKTKYVTFIPLCIKCLFFWSL
jgi:endonuclease III